MIEALFAVAHYVLTRDLEAYPVPEGVQPIDAATVGTEAEAAVAILDDTETADVGGVIDPRSIGAIATRDVAPSSDDMPQPRRPRKRQGRDTVLNPGHWKDRPEALAEDVLKNASLGRAVLRFCNGNWADADELMLDLAVIAWGMAEELGENYLPFFITVARNKAIDRKRARDIRPQSTLTGHIPDMRDRHDTIAAALTRMEVQALLAQLDEVHSAVLKEVYLKDRTVAQAATTLGIPPGTVKSRVFYGIRRLRELLGEQSSL